MLGETPRGIDYFHAPVANRHRKIDTKSGKFRQDDNFKFAGLDNCVNRIGLGAQTWESGPNPVAAVASALKNPLLTQQRRANSKNCCFWQSRLIGQKSQ